MTTLADVRRGDVFLAGFRCSAADQQAGLTLGLYGPGRDKMADAQIAPDGTVTGTLAAAPALIPAQLATGFAPVSVGDVLQNGAGETLVCQWTRIGGDGTVLWFASAAHHVVYPAAGWTVAGHVDLVSSRTPGGRAWQTAGTRQAGPREADGSPCPIPTTLTTEAVTRATDIFRREITALRDLHDKDLAALRELLDARFDAMDHDRDRLWEHVDDIIKRFTDALNDFRAEVERRDRAGRQVIEQRLTDLDKARAAAAGALTAALASEREYIIGQITNALAETRRVGDVAQEKFAAVDALFASNALALAAALAAPRRPWPRRTTPTPSPSAKSESSTKETIAPTPPRPRPGCPASPTS